MRWPSLLLIVLFLASQVIGLSVLQAYVDVEQSLVEGKTVFSALPFDQERPPVSDGGGVFVIIIALAIGTVLALALIQNKWFLLWKLWFFVAVFVALAIAFAAYVNQWIALLIAIVLATFKLIRQNVYVHNVTELFIYAGIAVVLVPLLNLWTAVVMLLILSVYDYWAVFKTKHMVTMSEAQREHAVFAGLRIPYLAPKEAARVARAKAMVKKTKKKKTIKVKVRSAMLGGGDICFALLFAGTVLTYYGYLASLIVPVFSTAAVAALSYLAKKEKFYPAMPFISAGCLLGLAVVVI